MSKATEGFERLLQVFSQLRIPYAVGGSVASSAYGMPRSTMDVDLVVDIPPDRIDAFSNALQPEFYADADLIAQAFKHRRAANVIHLASAMKFDLFPLGSDAYSHNTFARRDTGQVRPDGLEAVTCSVATVEDVILRKLEWYRMGGESSQRQWRDLQGMRAMRRDELDMPYLRLWAQELKVSDLLERLLAETSETSEYLS